MRQYLLAHGNHVEGMRLLAKIGLDLDVTDDAEFLLARVLELAPQHREARYEYAIVLLKRHKHVRAREEMEKLLALDPDNRVYRTTHATVCTGFGDYDQALPPLPGASGGDPERPGAAFVDRARPENARPDARGHRLLPRGRRHESRTSARPTGASRT